MRGIRAHDCLVTMVKENFLLITTLTQPTARRVMRTIVKIPTLKPRMNGNMKKHPSWAQLLHLSSAL